MVAFRAESEHTIDGNRMGLEMQVMHMNYDAGAQASEMAQISVLFDPEKADEIDDDKVKIIDTFFHRLMLGSDQDAWSAASIPFGELMSLVDTENRWVYQAKQSMPPCKEKMYYNVLRTVYPIKQEHLDLIKGHISNITGVSQAGNFKKGQKADNSVVLYYKDRTPIVVPDLVNDFQDVLADLFTTILIIWCVIAFGALIWLLYKMWDRKKMAEKREQELASQPPKGEFKPPFQSENTEGVQSNAVN